MTIADIPVDIEFLRSREARTLVQYSDDQLAPLHIGQVNEDLMLHLQEELNIDYEEENDQAELSEIIAKHLLRLKRAKALLQLFYIYSNLAIPGAALNQEKVKQYSAEYAAVRKKFPGLRTPRGTSSVVIITTLK